MRLSDAIRLGAMMTVQCFGDFSDDSGEVPATCALGAAGQASGHTFQVLTDVMQVWPFTAYWGHCPDCHTGGEIAYVVYHLNDDHLWTRERIADWVETLESPQAPPAVERTPDEEFAWVSVEKRS